MPGKKRFTAFANATKLKILFSSINPFQFKTIQYTNNAIKGCC